MISIKFLTLMICNFYYYLSSCKLKKKSSVLKFRRSNLKKKEEIL